MHSLKLMFSKMFMRLSFYLVFLKHNETANVYLLLKFLEYTLLYETNTELIILFLVYLNEIESYLNFRSTSFIKNCISYVTTPKF